MSASDFWYYQNKITELGLKYTADDGESCGTWPHYVCVILNKIYGKECFDHDFVCNYFLHLPIKFNGEFVKKTNSANYTMRDLYEFLENQILLFKLDKILF